MVIAHNIKALCVAPYVALPHEPSITVLMHRGYFGPSFPPHWRPPHPREAARTRHTASRFRNAHDTSTSPVWGACGGHGRQVGFHEVHDRCPAMPPYWGGRRGGNAALNTSHDVLDGAPRLFGCGGYYHNAVG